MLKRQILLGLMIFTAACQHTPPKEPHHSDPQPGPITIIGHRGASGQLPEHTLQAYSLAVDQGADFIEPDLVITKDNVLIARHENNLEDTTNVAQVFPDRKSTKIIDGKEVTGFFSEDFTYLEIRQLRARQRVASRPQSFNDQYRIPTFNQILDWIASESSRRNRVIGVYPELKHSTYFQSIQKPLEPVFLDSLRRTGLTEADSPIFIQSFEVSNLKTLRQQVNAPLVQLISISADPRAQPFDQKAQGSALTYRKMITADGLKEVKQYANAIGISKSVIKKQPDLVSAAHEAGLKVHVYTFKEEDSAQDYKRMAWEWKVDGIFTDFPDQMVKALHSGQ